LLLAYHSVGHGVGFAFVFVVGLANGQFGLYPYGGGWKEGIAIGSMLAFASYRLEEGLLSGIAAAVSASSEY
jgi:hypothetical protein